MGSVIRVSKEIDEKGHGDKCPCFLPCPLDSMGPALLCGSWVVCLREPLPNLKDWACDRNDRGMVMGGVVLMPGASAGLRRVMLRAHRQAWCWQDEWIELSMADIRALEEETARMLAQRMAKCNTGSEGPEVQTPGKPSSTEARPGTSSTATPDGPEVPPGPDASPDASFGKQWSSSSRSSYSSQHGGEAGVQESGRGGSHSPDLVSQAEAQVVLQVACLHRACLSGACRTLPETLRIAPRKNSLMPTVGTEAF